MQQPVERPERWVQPKCVGESYEVALLDLELRPESRVVGVGVRDNSVEGVVAAAQLHDDEDLAVLVRGYRPCRTGHEQRHRRRQGEQG